MEHFGDFLEHFLEEEGISKRQLCLKTGCNSGYLNRIIRNTKPMSTAMFEAVIRNFDFRPEQEQRLRDAFFSELYGENQYQRILYLKETWENIDNKIAMPSPQATFEVKNDIIQTVIGFSDIENAIRFIIQTELKKGEGGKVYTNYPFANEKIENIVYSEIVNRSAPDFFLNHFITFEEKNQTAYNFHALFSGIRYSKLKQNIMYIYENQHHEFLKSVFPLFFVSEDFALLFSDDLYTGVMVSDKKSLELILKNIDFMQTKYTPLATFTENELEMRNKMSKPFLSSLITDIASYPCVSLFAGRELFEAVARSGLPIGEQLINITVEHYKPLTTQNSDIIYFFSAEGITQWAKTGIIKEISSRWVTPIPVELRCKILKKLIEIVNQPDRHVYILDDTKFKISPSISLEVFENCFQIGFETKSDYRFLNSLVNLKDINMRDDFSLFRSYLIDGCFTYSQEYSATFLNLLLNECKDNVKQIFVELSEKKDVILNDI